MRMTQHGTWQALYEKAILKTNDEKLSHSIKDALEAINVRREDALLGRTSLMTAKNRSMDDAARILQFLQEYPAE
jgi:hypothetical protein